MNIFNLIKTASPAANSLTLGSVILLVIKIFIFNRMPEISPGGYEFGVLSDAILTSVVASYIFYLFVIHLKDQKDKETVRPYIEKHAKRIVGDCLGLLTEISKKSEIQLSLDSTKDEIEEAFGVIDPHSDSPVLISDLRRYANWPEFISYRNKRAKSSCRKLLDHLPYLDSKLTSFVADIDDCSLFIQVEMILNTSFNNKNMTFFTSTFHKYVELSLNLNKYIESKEFSR
jgi:hypothetical protein